MTIADPVYKDIVVRLALASVEALRNLRAHALDPLAHRTRPRIISEISEAAIAAGDLTLTDPADAAALLRLVLASIRALQHLREHAEDPVGHRTPPEVIQDIEDAIESVRWALGMTPAPPTESEG